MKNEKIVDEKDDSKNVPDKTPKDAPEQPKEESETDESPKLKELEEKNKQLFERAKKAEEKLKEVKPLVEEKSEEQEIKTESNDPRDIVRLAKALEGYSEEEVNFIYRNAEDNELESIIKATKDEWVVDSITTRREKVAKEDKIPESGEVQSEEAVKGMTPKDMDEDPGSHREAFENAMKAGKQQEAGI